MSNEKYLPMGKHPIYVQTWNTLINDVIERPNFKECYLLYLDKLCKLFVEVDEIEQILDLEGRTYPSSGRYGDQCKNHPLIGQKNMCHKDIVAYSKMLGLGLAKDTKVSTLGKEEEEGWK